MNWSGGKRLALAYALGAGGYAVGLLASALLDLPSGAVIVWALATLGALIAFYSRWNNQRPDPVPNR